MLLICFAALLLDGEPRLSQAKDALAARLAPLERVLGAEPKTRLELSRSTASAEQLRAATSDGTTLWSSALAADDAFIIAYTPMLLVVVAIAFVSARAWLWSVPYLFAAYSIGWFNWHENGALAQFLGVSMPGHAAGYSDALAMARLFAQAKWVLLLGVTLASGTALLGALRYEWAGPVERQVEPQGAFGELLDLETSSIFAARTPPALPDQRTVTTAVAGVPWVEKRSADVVGLALSGGGIRSATFNLGLLQGLNLLGLLPLIDYNSTVSGGGYVGGFWSAWLSRQKYPSEHLFPEDHDDGVPYAEPIVIRHLREFSRFLAPRVGFFEAEMWQAVVAFFSGMLPSLAAAGSVMGLGLVAWLTCTFFLACPHWEAGASVAGLLTLVTMLWFEWLWKRGASLDRDDEWKSLGAYALSAATAMMATIIVQKNLTWAYAEVCTHGPWPVYLGEWKALPAGGTYDAWWYLAGIEPMDRLGTLLEVGHGWFLSPRLYDLTITWLFVGVLMLVGRALVTVVLARDGRIGLPAYDRAVMRVLALAVLWAAVATLWHVSVNVPYAGKTFFAGALATGTLFGFLRNWIAGMSGKAQGTGALERLKPYVPQILAYATVVFAVIAVGAMLIAWCGTDWWEWWAVCAAMGAAAGFVLLLDPSKFGLHSFYRDRIARAYLGASNRQGLSPDEPDRATYARKGDDVPMVTLRERPLHLVCAAANDLDGDPLGTLSRGARSATVSCHGLSLEDAWTVDRGVMLGSAVTAAAAAFNSNMGSLSMQLGPAVGFLATAMNLRLGLWLDLPAKPGAVWRAMTRACERLEARAQGIVNAWSRVTPPPRLVGRLLPGFRYYLEMFGGTRADDDTSEIHLSDGGHFENLALYELVRRHCRYIIVSDCGQDAEVAFDDFGNASRRIREDFGVDIEVDLRPLRHDANGLARQHLVVGTIHYTDFDKGVLLYVKPALTGDEPPDVLQYRTRNQQFPHETTANQFYDEAQWEAYRRLGKHTALVGLGFVSRFEGEVTAGGVFTQARQVWYPTPPGLMDRVLAMTNRFGTVESELQREGYAGILREVFPELDHLARRTAKAASGGTAPADGATAQDLISASETEMAAAIGSLGSSNVDAAIKAITTIRLAIAKASEADRAATTAKKVASDAVALQTANLTCLLRVIQLMEDVFTGCDLDTQWNHPLNMGWTNCFARWATAPTFQMWWPLLAPMYGPDFARFLQERFPVLKRSRDGGWKPAVEPIDDDPPDGIAWRWWRQRSGLQAARKKPTYAYNVTLTTTEGPSSLQLGLATVSARIVCGKLVARWTSDDFFVPPSLWGAGIGGEFMRELLQVLSNEGVVRCRVEVTMPEHRNDESARADRVGFIEFYKRTGFRLESYDEEDRRVTLVLDAMPKPDSTPS